MDTAYGTSKYNLKWEGEVANQHNHYHRCRNIDSKVHHELQGTIGIVHSAFPSSCDICREETGHHQ